MTEPRQPFTISPERVTLLVGATALLLPVFLRFVSSRDLSCNFDSLSHYYYGRFASDWFVGSLCFIGLLMMFLYVIRPGYPGFEGFVPRDRWIMKGAGLSAFLIAFFPTAGTGCDNMDGQIVRLFLEVPDGAGMHLYDTRGLAMRLGEWIEQVPTAANAEVAFSYFSLNQTYPRLDQLLHNVGALAMFAALGYFSLFVFTRKQDTAAIKPELRDARLPKGVVASYRAFNTRKQIRNVIYVLAGVVIFVCIAALIYQNKVLCADVTSVTCQNWNTDDWTLKVEWIALWAFAASWLVKGRVIPWLNDPPA